MNQWDIIAGKPHESKAFEENGEAGAGGIRPSILNIFVLREVVRESVRLKCGDAASSDSCGPNGDEGRRPSLLMTSKTHQGSGKRTSFLAKAKQLKQTIFTSQKELPDKNFRGWDVFDDQFEQAVVGHCHSCHK